MSIPPYAAREREPVDRQGSGPVPRNVQHHSNPPPIPAPAPYLPAVSHLAPRVGPPVMRINPISTPPNPMRAPSWQGEAKGQVHPPTPMPRRVQPRSEQKGW